MKEEMCVRFLILRFGSSREVLLTTPIVRCLKEQVKGAEIHYAVKKAYAPLLDANPYLHKVHILEDNPGKLVRRLKEEEFDYIIDLQQDFKSQMIRSRLRLISFDLSRDYIRKWMMVRLKINLLPEKHWTERCLDTVKVFDVVNDNKGLDFNIRDHEEVKSTQLPQEFRKGFVAFVIGARYQTRKLPSDMIIEICKKINYPVVLVGGAEDVNQGEIISHEPDCRAWNACGKYTFKQSASLIRQASMVISHDTVMMHVATAYRQRLISIWGNTIPGFGMAPYMPHKDSRIFEAKGLRCRPCSDKGYRTCPKKHFQCMRNINLKELVQHGRDILASI